MKIGIDARLIDETGVGRYIRNLIAGLQTIDKKNQYIVYLQKKSFDTFEIPNNRWQKRIADIRWHTVEEQLLMPFIFLKDRLDFVHIPYYSIPVCYPGKMIVTIHDLTILHLATGKATTLPYPLFLLKKFGYLIMMRLGLQKAVHIIAVSEYSKHEIIDHFHIPSDKITVTYEGVDTQITKSRGQRAGDPSTKLRAGNKKMIESFKPYFLYVGNAYPHKNIELLIHAFSEFKKEHDSGDAKLVLVGRDDFFYRRLKDMVKAMTIRESIVFFGHADDSSLQYLYMHALSLILPTQMEGFGLPALEALSLWCPLIVSDIPVFREILGDSPMYVHVNDKKALTDALSNMFRMTKEQFFLNKKEHIEHMLKRYNWDHMTRQTLALYEKM